MSIINLLLYIISKSLFLQFSYYVYQDLRLKLFDVMIFNLNFGALN